MACRSGRVSASRSGCPRLRPGRCCGRSRHEATTLKAPTEVYDAEYLAQLERYGARRIARRLGEIARSGFAEPAERLVLLCFESPETAEWACHRRTFAAWWLRQTGERVEELDR